MPSCDKACHSMPVDEKECFEGEQEEDDPLCSDRCNAQMHDLSSFVLGATSLCAGPCTCMYRCPGRVTAAFERALSQCYMVIRDDEMTTVVFMYSSRHASKTAAAQS